jgi:polysaccharide pyruvyl transferase WcaK-like protein
MELLIMQSSPASRHFLPLRSNCSQHLFSNTLNLCFSLSVRDPVSHPYRNRQNY